MGCSDSKMGGAAGVIENTATVSDLNMHSNNIDPPEPHWHRNKNFRKEILSILFMFK